MVLINIMIFTFTSVLRIVTYYALPQYARKSATSIPQWWPWLVVVAARRSVSRLRLFCVAVARRFVEARPTIAGARHLATRQFSLVCRHVRFVPVVVPLSRNSADVVATVPCRAFNNIIVFYFVRYYYYLIYRYRLPRSIWFSGKN